MLKKTSLKYVFRMNRVRQVSSNYLSPEVAPPTILG